MSIFHELRRRNVFRVAAAYIAVAWLVVQVAETLLPVFDFGPAALRTVVILAAIGFLPAVIVAWLFELTPEGLKPDEGKDRDVNFSRKTRERLNQVVMVSLVLAVTYFAVDKFILAKPDASGTMEDVSIAVMPFVNLSDSEDMAFFSDGVAEDILGQLARTKGLRCIARSSSFAMRDPNIPAAAIGERLGVDYLLTGTLRHSNDAVRVNVRLVETATETLVWSQNYDRDLDDVFALQDDISRQVVGSIAPELTTTAKASEAVAAEEYVKYLRARHVYTKGRNNQDAETVLEAKLLFEELLQTEPNYARALASLADVWSSLAILGEVSREEGYDNATEYATLALRHDPLNAEAWYALGDIRVEYFWDLPSAQEAYSQALALDPKDADGLRGYAYFLRQAGRTDDAVGVYNETLSLDPFSQRAYQGLYLTYVNGGLFDEALRLLEEAKSRNPMFPLEALMAPVYAIRKEYELLNNVISQTDQIYGPNLGRLYSAIAMRGLGDSDSADEKILEIRNLPVAATPSNLVISNYFAAFGEFETAIEFLDAAAAAKEIGLGEALTQPLLEDLRKEPAFWAWVERSGIRPLKE